MKHELKISTLSIACVLCTVFVAPAFAAAPVRSLGGVGTYSSASNAASAKASGTTGSSMISAVRGGSMRVNNSGGSATAPATGTTSTRVATTPRLSIGKYLSGSATLGSVGSANLGSAGSGGVGGGKNWEERIQTLEQFVGFDPDSANTVPDRLDAIEGDIEALQSLDIAGLQKDVMALTNGVVSDIEYDDLNGKLLVKMLVDGQTEEKEYDFATKDDLLAFEGEINQIVANAMAAYAPVVDLDAAVAELEAAQIQIDALAETLAGMGDTVVADRLAELSNRIDELELNVAPDVEAISALQTTVAALQQEVANIPNSYATKAALDGLQNALSGYVTVETFNAVMANVYTKGEVDALVESAGNFNPELYYDKTAADTKFATKAEIPVVPTNVSELANDAGYVNTTALNEVKAVADAAQLAATKSEEASAEAVRMANLNAEEIAGLDNKYATDQDLAGVKKELSDEISAMTGGKNLGALAYQDTVSTADIDNGAVTSDKIDLSMVEELGTGDMVVIKKTDTGAEFVSIEVIGANGKKI